MQLTTEQIQNFKDLNYNIDDIKLIDKFICRTKESEKHMAFTFFEDKYYDIINIFSQYIVEDKILFELAKFFFQYKNTITTDNGTQMSIDNNTQYEHVNHPTHYNNYDTEVIDMMEKIWGKQQTAVWCKLTAFKYRMRMGTKPDNDINQDLQKESWYLQKYNELISQINSDINKNI